MQEMKPMMNGHDEEQDLAARDAARIAAREVPPATADLIGVDEETLERGEQAFKQQQHDDILNGLDVYADAYSDRLKEMNDLNLRLGQDMLQQVAKVKGAITTMWLLGAAIDAKQKRDADFVEKSHRELEKVEHPT
jgi:hypothetical protein